MGRAQSGEKRKPMFAGTWYEADPARLVVQLEKFFDNARASLASNPADTSFAGNRPAEGRILAAIAPHAGYMFSGQTAAFAYDRSRGSRNVECVFVLGPSHYVGFQGAALPAEKFFSTPLGDLAVDAEIIAELATYPIFSIMPEVHKKEHSLEMQLPLIKQAFGDVKIVPVIIGQMYDEPDIRLTAQILRRYLKENDVVIVSSDFTHYGPRYQYQPFKGNISENVRNLDSEAFACLQNSSLSTFLDFKERTDDTICGFYPIAVLLSMLPRDARASLLNYKTSRDSLMEDDDNSVSYLAIVFSDPSNDKGWTKADEGADEQLTAEDKENLLKIARLTLSKHVVDKRSLTKEELQPLVSPAMQSPMGAFVTLYKKLLDEGGSQSARDHKELRGCVGYIWPVKSLLETVMENTVGAASRDYRFVPVTPSELDGLEIDINVLTAPRRISSWKEIVVGRDGVVMYKGGKQSVFLPSVATDFGWDVEQFLSQLSLKAGCGADGWKQGAQFDVFQAQSFGEK